MRGLQLAKNAGLKLEKCESIVDEKVNCTLSLQEIESTLKKYLQSSALVIVWQIQNIVWGKYENDQIKLNTEAEVNPNHWLECRIFNQNEEIHLKRKGNSLRGRYIRDDELGQGTFYVDSFSRLWGEEIGNSDGYIHLLDSERKLYMEVPCAEIGYKWYGLLTRNYIDSDSDTGLSGYIDYRFVAIEPAKDGE